MQQAAGKARTSVQVFWKAKRFWFLILSSAFGGLLQMTQQNKQAKVGKLANLWIFIQEWVQSKLEVENCFLQENSAKLLQMQANE